MADFTLSSGAYVRPYRCPWGAFPIRNYTISTGISSNAIQLGRVVSLDNNVGTNTARILPSSQTAGVVVSTRIVGVAAEAVSSNASTSAIDTVIPVWDCNPMVEFRGVTQGANLLSSHVGVGRALVWDSTLNIHKVDLGNSTVTVQRVLVTELIDAVGDSGGAVAFRFLEEGPEQFDSTASTLVVSNKLLAFYGRRAV